MSEINEATAAALAQMKICRQAVIDLGAAYGPHSGVYRESHHLTKLMDQVAEMLTGDEKYFHTKPHSTP
jgi:hypothetical protein